MRTLGLAALLMASTASVVAGADEVASATTVSPGDKVRLTPSGRGGRFTAMIIEVEPEAVVVRRKPGAAPLRVPLKSLQLLEVTRGQRGHAGEGALIGAVPGFVFGFLASGLACIDAERPCWGIDEGIFAGVLLGGLTAAAGALVGATFHTDRWTPVSLPAPRSPRVSARIVPVRGGVAAGVVLTF